MNFDAAVLTRIHLIVYQFRPRITAQKQRNRKLGYFLFPLRVSQLRTILSFKFIAENVENHIQKQSADLKHVYLIFIKVLQPFYSHSI